MNVTENIEPQHSEDPFVFDAERLRAVASKNIVRRGIAYFKEGRVIDLGWSEERVWASVEGSTPGAYQVDLFLDEDRELATECDCPFEWEPACKHVVATLLAYAARQPVAEAKVDPTSAETPSAAPSPSTDPRAEVGTEDESLSPLVEGIQAVLGRNLQQIVIAGGGLLVVATLEDASADQAIQALGAAAGVDVAVVDPRAWASSGPQVTPEWRFQYSDLRRFPESDCGRRVHRTD